MHTITVRPENFRKRLMGVEQANYLITIHDVVNGGRLGEAALPW